MICDVNCLMAFSPLSDVVNPIWRCMVTSLEAFAGAVSVARSSIGHCMHCPYKTLIGAGLPFLDIQHCVTNRVAFLICSLVTPGCNACADFDCSTEPTWIAFNSHLLMSKAWHAVSFSMRSINSCGAKNPDEVMCRYVNFVSVSHLEHDA